MKYRIYSLIDQKLLYTLPNGGKDPNSYRKWHAYDSSALIDAKNRYVNRAGREWHILYR